MFEVEQKYRLEDSASLLEQLDLFNAIEGQTQHHCDLYFNHPSRDFVQTNESLRIRMCNEVASITYKGAKLPGNVKAREELEWCLEPGDTDGEKMKQLLGLLGFRELAAVSKRRRPFSFAGKHKEFSLTIDEVEYVGLYAEVELVVTNESAVETAREKVSQFGGSLGLSEVETRSYLRMSFENQSRK